MELIEVDLGEIVEARWGNHFCFGFVESFTKNERGEECVCVVYNDGYTDNGLRKIGRNIKRLSAQQLSVVLNGKTPHEVKVRYVFLIVVHNMLRNDSFSNYYA